MPEITDTPPPKSVPAAAPRSPRLPSARASAVLATVVLALGVAVGAAIGPAPDASYAGSAEGIAQRLPQLIALLASRATTASTPAASTPGEPPSATAQSTPQPASTTTTPASTPSTPAASPPQETAGKPSAPSATNQPKLPAITNVWLIELGGSGFAEAQAQPTTAPYITGTLLPASTLLSGWSALSAGAFASEAALAEPPAPGATPPLLHSIVQPPCPEGAAGASCAPGTPGALSAADEFLKATLATITGTPSYREHGLIVVTFATVAIASQSGLPASASSATLTYEPPAGVALLSPFAKAGTSSLAFNPTSPRQSLEKLLH